MYSIVLNLMVHVLYTSRGKALTKAFRLFAVSCLMSQRLTKPTRWHVRPAKTQLGHPPSDQSSLSA